MIASEAKRKSVEEYEADADKAWEVLKPGIINILSTNFSEVNWEECYRKAYIMVILKNGDMLYNNLKELIYVHVTEVIRPSILAETDNTFFRKFMDYWFDFALSLSTIKDATLYLHRVYLQQQHRGLPTIKQIGYQMFRDEIILNPNVAERIKPSIYRMIELKRENEPVNCILLTRFREEVLLPLDFDQSYYQKEFEEWIIQKCGDYYRSMNQTFIKANNASQFFKQIYDFVNNEFKCIEHFLDSASLSDFKTMVVVKLFPVDHVHSIINGENGGLNYMLKNNGYKEFNILHELLTHIPNGIDLFLVDSVNTHVQDIHNRHINKIDESLHSKNVVGYVQHLYDLKTEFDFFMNNYFKVHSHLTVNIQQEIIKLLTPNTELLTLCFHNQLKQDKKTINDNDDVLKKAFELFKITREKDVFEKYYKKYLAQRLLSDKSNSYDSEKMVISQLKEECGTDFTRKIEGLLADIEISKTLMTDYQSIVDKNDIDFSIKVLTKNYWPIPEVPSCVLPAPAEAAFSKFKDFYLHKYSGRALTINPYFGFADLKATFYKNVADGCVREETKILTVTTLQMCILMKFNESDSFTYKKLLDETNILDKDLKRALASVAMGKESQRILTRVGNGQEIEENDIFSVNDGFTSQLNRIRIQMIPAKTNAESDQKEFQAKIVDDRKYEIEAAIIRVMKSQQKLIHNELITDVTKQLQSRFLPDPVIIKNQIESLIEREYLKRDKNNLQLYHYIS